MNLDSRAYSTRRGVQFLSASSFSITGHQPGHKRVPLRNTTESHWFIISPPTKNSYFLQLDLIVRVLITGKEERDRPIVYESTPYIRFVRVFAFSFCASRTDVYRCVHNQVKETSFSQDIRREYSSLWRA